MVATPSEYDYTESFQEDLFVSVSDWFEDMSDYEKEGLFYDYFNSFLGGPATPSNADYESQTEATSIDLEECSEVIPLSFPSVLSVDEANDFVNVLRFDCSISGTDYTLLFPPSAVDSLFVDSGDRLWNMATSTVQGVALDGTFNPLADEGTLVYLTPCLANNFSDNHDGQSPNYLRHYYWSNYDRLTYTQQYVTITVDKAYHTFFVSETLMYLLLFFVGTGVILCWLNRWRRY